MVEEHNIFFDRSQKPVIKPVGRKVKKRTGVYGICIVKNRVLLVLPVWSDIWGLPGGGVKNSESELEALKKEFVDETGYEILKVRDKPFTTIQSWFYADDIDIFYDSKSKYYIVDRLGDCDDSLIQRDETRDVRWIDLGVVKYMTISERHSIALHRFITLKKENEKKE